MRAGLMAFVHPPVESGCRSGGSSDSRLAAVPELRARTAFSGLSTNRRINVSLRKRRREVCGRLESRCRRFRHKLSSYLDSRRLARRSFSATAQSKSLISVRRNPPGIAERVANASSAQSADLRISRLGCGVQTLTVAPRPVLRRAREPSPRCWQRSRRPAPDSLRRRSVGGLVRSCWDLPAYR